MAAFSVDPGLEEKYAALVAENQRIRDEFNSQRAKLKELFIQKEGTMF